MNIPADVRNKWKYVLKYFLDYVDDTGDVEQEHVRELIHHINTWLDTLDSQDVWMPVEDDDAWFDINDDLYIEDGGKIFVAHSTRIYLHDNYRLCRKEAP
jgi:hypothetical protein